MCSPFMHNYNVKWSNIIKFSGESERQGDKFSCVCLSSGTVSSFISQPLIGWAIVWIRTWIQFLSGVFAGIAVVRSQSSFCLSQEGGYYILILFVRLKLMCKRDTDQRCSLCCKNTITDSGFWLFQTPFGKALRIRLQGDKWLVTVYIYQARFTGCSITSTFT